MEQKAGWKIKAAVAAIMVAGIGYAAYTDINGGAEAHQNMLAACNHATDLAVTTFIARRDAGMSEEYAVQRLVDQGVTQGLTMWAVKRAFWPNIDASEDRVRGEVYGECLDMGGKA